MGVNTCGYKILYIVERSNLISEDHLLDLQLFPPINNKWKSTKEVGQVALHPIIIIGG